MNREDAKKLLGENATEEQVTNLLNTFHGEIEKKDNEIKSLTDKINSNQSEIDRLLASDKELQKIKLDQMTEQEKAKAKEEALDKQISEYKRLTNSTKAKSVLIGAGISSERADELVSKFVKEDEQATLDLANDFVAELNSVKEATEKQVKDDLAKINVKPSGSNINPKADEGAMTWEKFQSMTSEEQNKFQEEHPEEFNNL